MAKPEEARAEIEKLKQILLKERFLGNRILESVGILVDVGDKELKESRHLLSYDERTIRRERDAEHDVEKAGKETFGNVEDLEKKEFRLFKMLHWFRTKDIDSLGKVLFEGREEKKLDQHLEEIIERQRKLLEEALTAVNQNKPSVHGSLMHQFWELEEEKRELVKKMTHLVEEGVSYIRRLLYDISREKLSLGKLKRVIRAIRSKESSMEGNIGEASFSY